MAMKTLMSHVERILTRETLIHKKVGFVTTGKKKCL